MNYLHKKIIGVVILLLIAVSSFTISSQNPLGKREKKNVVEKVINQWNDWETVSISGKLKMDMLPLSPSLKIFMERDSLILISLRAPLVGEVGRAEIDSDSILVVNKMKKTYVKESIGKVLASYPGSLSDLQELLLGRIVIPGNGLLSAENRNVVDLFQEEPAGYTLLPGENAAIEGFDYGYLIDGSLRTTALAVVPTFKEGIIVGLTYSYPEKGYTLTASYQSPKKTISGTLELDSPEWGAKSFSPVKINSKFRRMEFKQFMKSF